MTKQTEELAVAEITVGERFRKDLGDLQGLAASIKENDLLQPIVVDKDKNLIAGQRRLEAFKLLGRDKIPARILDVPSLLLAERDENEVRKDFTISERIKVAEAVETELGNRQGQRTDLEHRENIYEVQDGGKTNGGTDENGATAEQPKEEKRPKRTAEVAAKAAGFGNETTYRQARKVVESAAPEVVELMDRGEIAPYVAAKMADLTKAQQKKIVAKVRAGGKATDALKELTGEAPAKADDRQGWDYFGKLIRFFDDRGNVHKKDKFHKACMQAMGQVEEAFKAWQEATKEKGEKK